MRVIYSALLTATLTLFLSAPGFGDSQTYSPIGNSLQSSSGLTLTVDQLDLIEKPGSTQLVIRYTQRNETPDKTIPEGRFKLFMIGGKGTPQYGAFNKLFPGDTRTRSHIWEWDKSEQPWLIEWEADFFAMAPTSTGLKFKVGQLEPVPPAIQKPTPTPSASLERPTPTVSATSTPSALEKTQPKIEISSKSATRKILVSCTFCKGRTLAIHVNGFKTWSKMIQENSVLTSLTVTKGRKLVTVKLSGGLVEMKTFTFK